MLPTISTLEINDATVEAETTVIHKIYDWDFETGDFVLKDGKLVELEGLDYVIVWSKKTLLTELGTLIYDTYGSGHYALIGKVYDREYVRAEFERTIKEALLTNEVITNVYDFEFEMDGSLLSVNFKLASIYGEGEVSI